MLRSVALLGGMLIATFVLPAPPAAATSWGLNSLGDSVFWSDVIVLAHVDKVVKVVKPVEQDPHGQPRGKADLQITVLEPWKGELPETTTITQLDLGDPTFQATPFPPLPDNLQGHTLFLMLRKGEDGQTWEAYHRGILMDDTVEGLALAGVQRMPLQTLRSIVEQLELIQTHWRRHPAMIPNQSAALSAFQTGLHSEYVQVRWYAARRLCDLPIPTHVVMDMIDLAAGEEDFWVRALLAKGIAGSGDPLAAQGLIDILRARPEDCATIEALTQLTSQKFGGDVGQWEQWWRDSAGQVDEPSVAAEPNSAVEVLVQALGSRDFGESRLAIRTLTAMGSEAVPLLIEALQQGDMTIKENAARTLGQIGERAAPAVPALVELGEVKNDNVRVAVFRALGRIGAQPELVVPLLRKGLRSPSAFVQSGALHALRELGPSARDALPDIKQFQTSAQESLRETAQRAVDSIEEGAD